MNRLYDIILQLVDVFELIKPITSGILIIWTIRLISKVIRWLDVFKNALIEMTKEEVQKGDNNE